MADLRSLVAALRRYSDPVASSDPLIGMLVARLASLPSAPKPSLRFRAELRAQLVAVTPRLVAEGLAPDVALGAAGRPRRAPGRVRAWWHRVPLRRPLAVLGTLTVIFGLLLTGAVWLSSSTLPGDSLYGLKRASENVELSLTRGDGARGNEYLTLAKRRANEVSKLLARASALAGAAGAHAAGGVVSQHTSTLITGTLGDADADVSNASRLLTGQAVRSSSDDSLQTLLSWTPDQTSRLTVIADRIPAGALHDRAVASEQLAERVLDRATRLHGNIGCSCLTETSSDDLGPLPCTLPCNPPPAKSGSPSAPAPGRAVTSPGGASAPRSTVRSTATSGGASLPAIPGLPSTTGSGGTTAATRSVPSGSAVPSGVPSLPLPGSGRVVVNPCRLTNPLGTVGLGPCGPHLHLHL